MLNSSCSIMYYLGFHIGSFSYIRRSSDLNFYINGIRKKYSIIDLKKSIFFLRKGLLFLKKINSSSYSNNLFFHSGLKNYMNSKDIIYLFLKDVVFYRTRSSFVYINWIHGVFTNYNNVFLKFIKSIWYKIFRVKSGNKYSLDYFNLDKIKEKRKNKFINFFMKLFFLLIEKGNASFIKKNKNKYNKKILNDYNYLKDMKSNSHLWKIVLFVRYFWNFFSFPDCFCAIDSSRKISPILEFSSLKIPVVSIIDTDYYMKDNITYFSFFNTSSLLSTIFFFSLISNVICKSRINSFIKHF